MIATERRVHRSHVPSIALQCLLDAQMRRASLDAISIADHDGLLVASASVGSVDCETLAAVAPSLVSGGKGSGTYNSDTVRVASFDVSGQTFYVALRGGDPSMDALISKLSTEGAKRILS